MLKWRLVGSCTLVILITSLANGATQMGQSSPVAKPTKVERKVEGCESRLQRSAFSFRTEPRADLAGAHTGPAIMSRRGELFVVLSHAGRTGVYAYAKDKFTIYQDGNFENVSDLFESRGGRMYFAYNTPTTLTVMDVRTGNAILTKALAEIPHIGDIIAQLSSESPLYRPVLYETGAGVHVALVPRSEDLYLDEAFSVPLYSLNLRTGDGFPGLLHSGMIRYDRMQDGHVYAVGWEREMGGPANTLLIYDLNTQKTLLREKFERQQDPPIFSSPLNLFYRAPRQPELVMHLQSPTGKVLIYDREERKFQPLAGLSRSKTMAIEFFNDEEGKPWFAAIEGSGSAGLSPEFFSLIIQPMAGIHGAAIVDLDLENPYNDISAVEMIERPEGRLFLAWERTVVDGKVRASRVHIYDQKTRKLEAVQIPTDWPGAIRKKSFWDSTASALVTYFVHDDGWTPEFAVLSGGESIVVDNPPTAPMD